jgi:hypothetical protein
MASVVAVAAMILTVTAVARADSGDPAPQHRVEQPRPVKLGTSGSNINHTRGAFCFVGTLGALVADAGGQYVLSNNHVLAMENKATVGDAILQPGLADQGCSRDTNDRVANLERFEPIRFNRNASNTVDAAIAKVRPPDQAQPNGYVDSTGSILDIGTLSSAAVVHTVNTINMAVKKSGRTTGLTTGTISSVDATVLIRYGSGLARFVHQVMITPGSFSAGGDSGSLIVEATATNPRAAGLLFAGSSTHTIANPMCGPGDSSYKGVLDTLGVNMVGTPGGPSCPTSATIGDATQESAWAAKRRNEDALLRIPSVVGVAVGQGPAVEVYLAHENAQARQQIPPQVDSVPVRVVVTGEFEAR